MRIWSLHPKYLDSKGLVALWRETLLAKNVLEGKTKGYINHPQLIRFKQAENPLDAINYYLSSVWNEAARRSYKFNQDKFLTIDSIEKIEVTTEQLNFEKNHLLKKLRTRNLKKFNEIRILSEIETNPLFKLIKGEIELWERN